MNSRLTTGLLLISLMVALPLAAQPTSNYPANPVPQPQCTTVALISDAPELPYRLVAPYLLQRPDFQVAKLVLGEEPGDADVLVQLHKGDPGYTGIQITNRLTRQHQSMISVWTGYPGMVATDTMELLKLVCAGLNVASAPSSVTAPCGDVTLMRPGRSLAACSHTSWMDNREIYEALKARDELTQHSVQLLPACGGAGTMLDITHNLDRTAEWNWKLGTAQGQTISEGMVIASSGRTAAARIAEDAVRNVPNKPADQPSASVSQCFTQAPARRIPSPSAQPKLQARHGQGRLLCG